MFRNLVLVLTLLCHGCAATMVPLDHFTPSRLKSDVKVGEHVIIEATNGTVYDLTVYSVQSDALFGTAGSGKRYKVPYEAIQEITVERYDNRKTGGVVIGLVAVATVAFVWALIRGLQFESGPSYESGGGGGGNS